MIHEKTTEKRLRLLFGAAFFLLLLTEAFIAMYVHDAFIRPYVGDILVVIVLYFGFRMVFPKKKPLLPLWLFIFAAGVEFLQYFQFVKLLGLENNVFFRIVLGSTFDWMDILCYGLGGLLLAAGQHFGPKSR